MFLRALKGTQCPIRDRTSASNLIKLDISTPSPLTHLRPRPRSARLRNASRQKEGFLAGQQTAVEANGRSLASPLTLSF